MQRKPPTGEGATAGEEGDKASQQRAARKLIRTADETGDRYAALYVVALHTGLREGELLGLRREDLDLEATTPTLQVRRTLSETREGHKFELPKSGKGRSMKLSRKATEALRSHRVRQAKEIAKARISVAG